MRGAGDVTGMVLDASRTDWLGLPGATVVAPDGTAAVTGSDGTFTLSGVPAGAEVALTVEGPAFGTRHPNEGYGTGIVLARVGHAETSVVSARLVAACAITQTYDGTEGGVYAVTQDSGCPAVGTFDEADLEVEVGDLQRADGTPFTGQLRVELAPMSLHTGEGATDWRLFTSVPTVGTTRAVVSGLEIRLLDGVTGDVVLVAPNETLLAKSPSSGNNDLSLTRTARRWDEASLSWIEDTTVINDGGRPTFLVPRQGIWMVHNEAPASQGCVRGRAVDASGDPMPNIHVRGSDRTGLLTDYTGPADGSFCATGEAGDEMYFELRGSIGAQHRKDIYSPLSFTGDCGSGIADCLDLGDVVLPAPVTRCATLTVQDAQSAPDPGRVVQAKVYSRGSAYLTEAEGTTNSQGVACLEFTDTEDYGYVELRRPDETTCVAAGPTLDVYTFPEASCANPSSCASAGVYLSCN